ncbi:hypothetical protein BGW37DRAFT_234125 [Umbelopsis sp. PMI_123]|nr:hypothetical protein BGW37DRAFT_234125 [Umbelopsis sp. PMI_123]
MRFYVEKPSSFSGGVNENPLSWLKNFQRLRDGMSMQDNEMLWIVLTHLKGAAAVWWETVEDDVTKWDIVCQTSNSRGITNHTS